MKPQNDREAFLLLGWVILIGLILFNFFSIQLR